MSRPITIDGISKKVIKAAQSDGACLPTRNEQQERVGDSGVMRMKRVKTDAATFGVEDGGSEEVV